MTKCEQDICNCIAAEFQTFNAECRDAILEVRTGEYLAQSWVLARIRRWSGMEEFDPETGEGYIVDECWQWFHPFFDRHLQYIHSKMKELGTG